MKWFAPWEKGSLEYTSNSAIVQLNLNEVKHRARSGKKEPFTKEVGRNENA